MNDYKELVEMLRHQVINDDDASEIADAIEQLVKERDYIPVDTLRKYHAWLLEKYIEGIHKNQTSEKLRSIDTAAEWLRAYADYKGISVNFGVREVEHEAD